jgi:vacuolar-type H+-ATPase subunit I/STV1
VAQTIGNRVEELEARVAKLEQLPERIDGLASQIVQLRTEMHGEFSAVRTEIREEIRLGDEETRRYMRVLHEEVISRIAMIQEGQDASRPRRGKTDTE